MQRNLQEADDNPMLSRFHIRRLGWRLPFSVVIVTLAAMTAWISTGAIKDRRTRLLQQEERDIVASVDHVAALVNDRAQDIRNDMTQACEVRQHAEHSRTLRLELVRSHLIALNRSGKHYLKLWYLEKSVVATEVSGLGASQLPVPQIPQSEVDEIDARARANPGTIVAMQALVPLDSPYDSLRLLGLATHDGDATVEFLVNMDAVFDSLQRRAHLPNLDLWVIDSDKSVLVDPDSPHRTEVLTTVLHSTKNGTALLGQVPSIWPFSDHGADTEMIAWRTSQSQPFPWVTAVAEPLEGITTALHELATKILFAGTLALMALGLVAGALFWQAGQQAVLRERVHTLSTIDRLREQLLHLEKLSTLGQVAAGLAHEMGTPLGVIAIHIEKMLDRSQDQAQHKTLTVMKEQIARIDRIMRHVLQSARPATVELGEVSLRRVVQQVAELVAHNYDRRGIMLETGATGDWSVFGNEGQIEQVLLNLLVNACDACRPGDRVVVRVLAGLDSEGRRGVEVADTGPGIATEAMPRVFEPFFTTKSPGQGTGLGLSIVKEIVEHHGGRVELTSSQAGTRVTTWWLTQRPPSDVLDTRRALSSAAAAAAAFEEQL